MTIFATGLSMILTSGAQAAPCPTGTVSVNLTSSGDAQSQLTDMLNCTGQGVFNATWYGDLPVGRSVDVSGEKNLTITGVNGTALYVISRDNGVLVEGAHGGMFSVSNGSILTLNNMTLDGDFSQDRTAVTVTYSSSLYVVDCEFRNHRGSTQGGDQRL